MRIIITGGAGCLGSNLIEHYVPAGHEVLAIDNFATGKREVLPQVSGLTVIEGSIADNNLITQCFDDFEPTHVIHSAAAYKDPADWHEDTATNIIGTINVAQAAARHHYFDDTCGWRTKTRHVRHSRRPKPLPKHLCAGRPAPLWSLI